MKYNFKKSFNRNLKLLIVLTHKKIVSLVNIEKFIFFNWTRPIKEAQPKNKSLSIRKLLKKKEKQIREAKNDANLI